MIEGIFDFSGFLVGLKYTDREIIGQKYFFASGSQYVVIKLTLHLTPFKKTLQHHKRKDTDDGGR